MDKKQPHVIILGAGRSGKAAVRLLDVEGAHALLLDQSAGDALPPLDAIDLAVISPGFATDHPWCQSIQRAGVPVISEFELGARRFGGKIIALTGSNGKSTAVKWIAEMLHCAGQTAIVCGNYGYPVCDAVLDHPDADWLVIELSSFQLEIVQSFSPDVAILLNVLPNHLDRHGSMAQYEACKMNLFAHLKADAIALLPSDLGGELRADISGTYFDNPILKPVTASAVDLLAQKLALPACAVERSARAFEPLPHRVQLVREIAGVRFVDDSKATNLAGVEAALKMQAGRVRLIAGGKAKEKNFNLIKEVLAEKVICIYLVGNSAEAMGAAWGKSFSCKQMGDIGSAVKAAWDDAQEGETILLSPGCTSFDQYTSFAERGRHFEQEVINLNENGEMR